MSSPALSRRTALILFGLAIIYITLVFQSAESHNRTGCKQTRDARIESNRRVTAFKQTSENLVRMSRVLSETRDTEADSFAAIGRKFKIEESVAPLVNRLRLSSDIDSQIEASQRAIRVDMLPLPEC